MPFNVKDASGNHIGFIIQNYPRHISPVYLNTFMVALTEDKIEIDINRIKDYIAGILDCRGLFGKINEERLKQKLYERVKYENLKGINKSYENMLKFVLLKTSYDCDIQRFINTKDIMGNIRGYVLLDIDNVKTDGDNLIMEESFDIPEIKLVDSDIPIIAEVSNYPIVYSNNSRIESWSSGTDITRLQRRNHTHLTRIEVKSGNFKRMIEVPILMNVRKGMSIQLYIINNEIRKVFCGDMMYIF